VRVEALLTDEEVRVLGALVEKSLTTPEYYPLSLNALKLACNQKSSREPVVEYDDATVARALEGLRDKHLVWYVDQADARVQKYRHRFAEALDLSPEEVAVLAVLLLRGPQTAGEIRGRTGRMAHFPTGESVESVLAGLCGREESPPVVRLARQPGRKEHRYAHALSGLPAEASRASCDSTTEPAPIAAARSERERLAALEARVEALSDEVAALRETLDAFRRQFE
jgi:uncharacterized protein YceH (UPF0502 family)